MLSMFSGILGGGSSPAKTPSKNGEANAFQEPKIGDLEACVKVIQSHQSLDSTVSSIRRIAEIVVYAEQRDFQQLMDMFFEKNVTGIMRNLALQKDTPFEIQVQVLQTFSILAQSLRNEINVFQFLSQNHLNMIIAYPFDFANGPEELLAHYVSLLKTVALRLDQTFCQFFYDARDGGSFPLYDRACETFSNEEPLVRAAVRSVILMVHRVEDTDVDKYVCRRIDYFESMCVFIRERFVRLKQAIEAEDFTTNWITKIDAGMADVLDDFSFLQDVLAMRETRQSGLDEFVSVVVQQILNPLLSNLADHSNLWGLAQCCLAIKSDLIIQHIYQHTFGKDEFKKQMLVRNLNSEDDRLVLATVTLAFFFVDRIENDPTFMSRKKYLNLTRGTADDSVLLNRLSIGSTTEVEDSATKQNSNNSNAASAEETSQPAQQVEHVEEDKESSSEKFRAEKDKDKEEDEEVLYDYPSTELVDTLLAQLEMRTRPTELITRPVVIRILSKLLVHISFDSRLLDTPERFLTVEQSKTLRKALSNAAISLKEIASKVNLRESLAIVEAFEDEWRELKSGPLRVSALVTNPASILPSEDVLKKNIGEQIKNVAVDDSEVANDAASDEKDEMANTVEGKSQKQSTIAMEDSAATISGDQQLSKNQKDAITGESLVEVNKTQDEVSADKDKQAEKPPSPQQQLQQQAHDKLIKLRALLGLKIPLAYRRPLDSSEHTRTLANIFMVLRLCRVSLEKEPDVYFPAVGQADVDSIREDSAIDLRKCEFLETKVLQQPQNSLSKTLLLVLVAGAMVLVEPDNDKNKTGICRSVAPIHRIECSADAKDASLVQLRIRSARRIGWSSRVGGTKQEWLLTIKFDGEPKAIFAQEQIRRASIRARDDKFKRIMEMLKSCGHSSTQ